MSGFDLIQTYSSDTSREYLNPVLPSKMSPCRYRGPSLGTPAHRIPGVITPNKIPADV